MTSLLVAAADSTSSILQTFILAMTSFPDIQKRAQEELDRVLCGRLPTHTDITSLPYLSAIIKEVIRYVSLGIDHCFFLLSGYVVFSVGDRLFPWVSTCYSYRAMFNLHATTTTCIGAVPHFAEEDTSYNGYFIPAGTVILANIW